MVVGRVRGCQYPVSFLCLCPNGTSADASWTSIHRCCDGSMQLLFFWWEDADRPSIQVRVAAVQDLGLLVGPSASKVGVKLWLWRPLSSPSRPKNGSASVSLHLRGFAGRVDSRLVNSFRVCLMKNARMDAAKNRGGLAGLTRSDPTTSPTEPHLPSSRP